MSFPPLNLSDSAFAASKATTPTVGWVSRTRAFVAPLNTVDFALVGTMLLLLYPVFRIAHLPLRINFADISVAFWFGTAGTGTFAAVLFSLIALPLSCTILPFVRRLKEKKGLIVVALIAAAAMFSLLGPWLGLVVTVDALTAGELLERCNGSLNKKLVDVLVPSAYLFCGVILLLAFNHAVPGIRNPGAYDEFLNHADWSLFHLNVASMVHSSAQHFPLWVFRMFEVIYYGMFLHITGALIFLAAAKGRRAAVAMVRTIVICNTIGLMVYASMPAIGPWANNPDYEASYPHALATYGTQEAIVQNAHMLWAHAPSTRTSRVDVTDAFISFPSLHVAGPLIAFWFIRGFRRTARAYFAVYLLCLVPSVLLLEWHYVIDLVAGFALACFAIWISHVLSDAEMESAAAAIE